MESRLGKKCRVKLNIKKVLNYLFGKKREISKKANHISNSDLEINLFIEKKRT